MAITLGVGPTTGSGTGTSLVLTLNGTTAGRSIVVPIVWFGATQTVTSVSCSGESNLTLQTRAFNSGSAASTLIATLSNNTTGGNKTITINFSASATAGASAVEVVNAKRSGMEGAAATNTASPSTNPSVSLTTGSDHSAIFSVLVDNVTATVGGGYTSIPIVTGPPIEIAQYLLDAGTAGVNSVGYTASSSFWASSALEILLDTNSYSNPSAGSLALTGSAPTVAQTNNVVIQPTAGSLALTGGQVFTGPIISATAGTLALAGAAPTVTYSGHQITPSAGSLDLTGFAPTDFVALDVTAGALALTGAAPNLAINGPISMLPLTGVGVGTAGTVGTGAATIQRLTATGTGFQPELGTGAPSLLVLSAVGYGPDSGAASLLALTATGSAANLGSGAPSMLAVVAANGAGAPSMLRLTASGSGISVLAEVYRTFVMNTRHSGVTEYQNFGFNSYAKIGNSYYAAGSTGLYLLEGDTDNGSDIAWSFRTAQLDDKNPGLKRLPEVLLGLRASGPIRVRVYKDDQTFFDYMLPAVKTNTIHQHRVVPGKGMRSRYYQIELQGVANAAAEIDSLQPLFSKTTRRLG